MNNPPLVSVIIPTYNRADQVGTAIKSVIDQTYKNVQILIIDDGSTDQTKKVVDKFTAVEYIVQKHAGQAAARNNGLRHAKGSLIASLDSDDTWYPSFLSACVTKLERDQLDFVFANWLQETSFAGNRDYLRNYPFLEPYLKTEHDGWVDLSYSDLRNIYLHGCPSPSSSTVIRKSSIANGWDPSISIGDDWCLLLDIILRKRCKASFCMDRLWAKNLNNINVYDGRKWNEVIEFLYVKDLKRILNTYRELLSCAEIERLEKVHVESLLILAIYSLLKKGNLSQSIQLLRQSTRIGLSRTLKIFPNAFRSCYHRRLHALNISSIAEP